MLTFVGTSSCRAKVFFALHGLSRGERETRDVTIFGALSSQPDTNPLNPGAVVLDRYRVVEHVAAGGHSVVYRGQDERLSRPVCIKVFSRLPSEHGVSRASYEHFVQEAFALSRLTHPNT